MVQLVAGGVAVQEPDGLAVTVYPVSAEPPVDAGAVHVAAIEPLPGVSDRPCGRDGTVVPLGVTDADPDAGPVPTAFVAVTVTAYERPLTRPVIVQPVAAAPPTVHVLDALPSLGTAVAV
jgi:hypothetical protein